MDTLRPARPNRGDTAEQVTGYTFISPFFVVFAVFGLFPILFTFWVSLHDWSLLGAHTWSGLDNYSQLLRDENFWNALINTLGIFVLATVPQLIVALALAQLLNQRLRARTFWRMGVLLPNITSVAAVGIIFTLLFARDFGLVNWLLSQVGVDTIDWQEHRWSSWLAISMMVDWRWTGYNALIFLAALQAVPKDLYEAASIDGASQVRQFCSITVPDAAADDHLRQPSSPPSAASSCSPSRCCSTAAPTRSAAATPASSRP